nr:hypothetical protein [Candidatus Sigynarchaeota archaeon]
MVCAECTNQDWGRISTSKYQFIKDENHLELKWPSREREGFIKGFIALCCVDAMLVIICILFPRDGILFLTIILALITPLIGSGIPQSAISHHFLIDSGRDAIETFSKNHAGKITRKQTYAMQYVEEILVETKTLESTSWYNMIFRLKEGLLLGEIPVIEDTRMNVMTEAFDLIKQYIKHLANKPLTVLDRYGAPLVLRDELYCTLDQRAIEGLVYICPGCHAAFCNACTTRLLAETSRCPSCDKEVAGVLINAKEKAKIQPDDKN